MSISGFGISGVGVGVVGFWSGVCVIACFGLVVWVSMHA